MSVNVFWRAALGRRKEMGSMLSKVFKTLVKLTSVSDMRKKTKTKTKLRSGFGLKKKKSEIVFETFRQSK